MLHSLKQRLLAMPLVARLTVIVLLINALVGVIVDGAAYLTSDDARHLAILLAFRSLAVFIAVAAYAFEATATSLVPWVLLFGGMRLGDIAIGIFSRSKLRFIPYLPPTVLILACLIPLAGERGRLNRLKRDEQQQ